MAQTSQIRTYDPTTSVVFQRTKERFGGLSNMAPNFPLKVNGIRIRTSEALYQACRFPHRPDVQHRIIDELSPMTAKMRSKAFRKESRSDWDAVRVKIMNWSLRVKLAQNWRVFSELLLKTGDRAIVEQSRKDDFWGAKPIDERTLVGMNVLGRLLMELREAVKEEDRDLLLCVQPLAIPNFMLGGSPIEIVTAKYDEPEASVVQTAAKPPHSEVDRLAVLQPSLFDVQVGKETTPIVQPVVSKMGVNIAILKLYPAMKDSAVEWLGEVPSQWEVLPSRAIFTEVKERDRPGEPMLSVTIKHGVIRQQDLLAGSSKKDSSNLDKSAYKLVRPGDIAYNKMRAWQGAVGVSDYQGIVSPAYVVVRPRKGVSSRYFHYLLRTPAFAKEAERWSYGITSDMWSLRPEHFKVIYACLPPDFEQTAIVRFLDHADRRIRRYIRAKQKLIALLEEQKQAIIHQAVTGRIDVRTGQPYPAYKPSGVKWLGDVPAHWEVRRLRHLVTERLTYGANAAAEYNDPTWPRYLRITDFSKNGRLRTDTFRSLPPEVAKDYLVEPGDVLLARSGATVGKAFLVDKEAGTACHAGYLIRARLNRSLLHPALFFAFTQSTGFVMWKNSTFILATIQNISADKYANLPIPVPPRPEQNAIVEFLDQASIDTAITRTCHQIDILREYRTRLIADVVTGKLDVREAVAALPEVDPLEADDELYEPIDGDAEADSDGLEAIPEEVEA